MEQHTIRQAIALIILISLAVAIVQAEEIPLPKGIDGAVYSESGSQVPLGTAIEINNTNNGFYLAAKTGKGPFSGRYSAIITGNDGDLLIVRAWNNKHSARIAVVLNGTMHDINLQLDSASSTLSLLPIPPQQAQASRDFSYALQFQNESPVSFTLASAPIGMSADGGIIRWHTALADVGSYSINITASDGTSAASQILTLTLTMPQAPVITSTPSATGIVGSPYTYQLVAQDADNDQLTSFIADGPEAMNLSVGIASWLPSQAGTYKVSLGVTDGILTAWQNFSINVASSGLAISSLPGLSATVGVSYTYQVIASKPASQLSYSLPIHPEGMSISPTGLIQWTPSQQGTFQVKLLVQDSAGEAAAQSFNINVITTNRAPVISSTPSTNAKTRQLYTYQVIASDPDGDQLLYSLVEAPSNMMINDRLGNISWVPSKGQKGNHPVTVKVVDSKLASGQQSYSVHVERNRRKFIIRGIAGIRDGYISSNDLDSGENVTGLIKQGSISLELYGEEGDIINISLWNATHRASAVMPLEDNSTLPEMFPLQYSSIREITIVKNLTLIYNYAVTEIRLNLAGTDDVDFSIEKSGTGYNGSEKPYQILEISPSSTSGIGRATIGFKVEKSWLTSGAILPDSVVMKRLKGNWNSLDTQMVGEDDNYYFYSASTPGFSIFAIVGPEPIRRQSQSPQTAYSISGVIYNADASEVPAGTEFTITNKANGESVNGKTGQANYPGKYSVILPASKGDLITLAVKLGSQIGSTTIELKGDTDDWNLQLGKNSLQLITGSAVAGNEKLDIKLQTILASLAIIAVLVGLVILKRPKGIKPQQAPKPERQAIAQSQYFRLADGTSLGSIEELINAFKAMSSETYGHHVTRERNDFSEWLEKTWHMPREASLLWHAENSLQAAAILSGAVKK